MKERTLNVLIACEESQTVCKAFRELGHEAFSCDIQECSGGHPDWHIQGCAIEAMNSKEWDLMIAHPPCTYMSRAGARWLFQGGVVNNDRYAKGLLAKEFFMQFYNSSIKHVAIENPTPLKIFDLPVHNDVVQPYQHGHAFSKRTLLWTKNLPKLEPTNIVTEYVPYLPSNTGGGKRGQKATFKNISQKDSSKTFEGIARAMAKQYSKHILIPTPTP